MGSIQTDEPRSRFPLQDKHISDLRHLIHEAEPAAQVLVPGDEGFAQTIKRWSAASEKPAGATVVPTSTAAISEALRYATKENLDVAVVGGGHSTAGTSSTSGGLLISLSKMRGIQVDATAKTLRVQGGATWGEVDAVAYEQGLATVGGTVSDTGVGGLTLGGGYGWLSGKHGLVIDNLLECTLVLASGEVVTCSKTQNEDLFWAIRGAGQNFGVAVEFVYQAFEQGEMYTGMIGFPPVPEIVEKVVEAANQLYTPGDNGTVLGGKGAGGLAFARPPPAGGGVLLLCPVVFNGSEEEAKEAYAPLFDLGPVMSSCAMVPYTVANQILNPPPIPNMRSSMKGASFTWPLRTGFVLESLKTFTEFTDKVEAAKASMFLFEAYDPVKVMSLAGNTDMSFSNRGWQGNGCIAPIWQDESIDGECRQWARDTAEMFKEELKRGGAQPGKGIGGVGTKGEAGAVMLYGNYDREFKSSNHARY